MNALKFSFRNCSSQTFSSSACVSLSDKHYNFLKNCSTVHVASNMHFIPKKVLLKATVIQSKRPFLLSCLYSHDGTRAGYRLKLSWKGQTLAKTSQLFLSHFANVSGGKKHPWSRGRSGVRKQLTVQKHLLLPPLLAISSLGRKKH